MAVTESAPMSVKDFLAKLSDHAYAVETVRHDPAETLRVLMRVKRERDAMENLLERWLEVHAVNLGTLPTDTYAVLQRVS